MSAGIMSFNKTSLDRHNFHRANHGAPALVWDQQCVSHAQNWANQLLSTNTFGHSSNRNDMGENIWTYYTTKGNMKKTDETLAQEAVDAWYNEVKKYSFIFPGFSKKTGHFTQLVWKETTRVGMAVAKDDTRALVCANYTPQGNVLAKKEFKKNVKKMKSGCSIM